MLTDSWRDAISLAGFGLTAIGLIYAIIQIRKSRAEEVNNVSPTQRRIRANRHRLAEKTKERKIAWKKDDAPNDAFRFSSPEFSLFLIRESRRAEPDSIRLEFIGPKGPAGKWSVWEGDDDWPLAEELYAEVYRFVRGSDTVFEGIKRFIEST